MPPLGRPFELPRLLDSDGLRNGERIFKLYAQITDGAVHLRMT